MRILQKLFVFCFLDLMPLILICTDRHTSISIICHHEDWEGGIRSICERGHYCQRGHTGTSALVPFRGTKEGQVPVGKDQVYGTMSTSRIVLVKRREWSMAYMAASLALGFLSVISPALCDKFASEWTVGGDDCLYESREACTRANAAGCVWCDLPRRCYSEGRSLELGEFCNRKKVKPFVEVSTCDEILEQQKCQHSESCRWCRSEAVDDGCFGEIEAVRLPKHIFTCAPFSPVPGVVNAVGLGI